MKTTWDANRINRMFDFDYTIHVIDLNNVHEAVTMNEDGSYSIFINGRLTVERQRYEALHALFHILENKYKKSDVQEIESHAHDIDFNFEFSNEIRPVNSGLS